MLVYWQAASEGQSSIVASAQLEGHYLVLSNARVERRWKPQ
jgi:hypothetical protein